MNIINNYIERYLLYLKINKNYSENTIISYQYDIKQFYEIIKIEDINISIKEVEIYMVYLKKYKASTIHRKISALKSFYNFLLKQNEIKINYFKGIQKIKQEEKLPKYLSIKEINNFLNNMIDNKYYLRDKAMFELIYATGIRVSELINLTINDIFLTKGLLKVNGKGKKERIIPINNIALKHLEKYLKNYRNQKNYKNVKYLFFNKNGTKLTRQGFYKILKKYNNTNLEITPHIFRHSIATHMLNQGVDIRIVQEILGHENIKTTEIYTHILSDNIKKNYNRYHILGGDYEI